MNLRLIPASLAAVALGLVLLLLAGWSGGLLGQVLTGIGVAALTAAFVGLFSDIFLRRQVLAEVLAKLQLKEDVVAAGILEVGRWDAVMPRLTDFFKDNSGDVDIVLVLGRTFASNHAPALVERAAKGRWPIRVSLLDPDYSQGLLEEYGKLFNRSADAIKASIQEAISIWEAEKQKLESQGTDVNLTIQKFSTIAPVTLYRAGDQMWVVFNTGRHSRSSPPAVLCQKTLGSDGLFNWAMSELQTWREVKLLS